MAVNITLDTNVIDSLDLSPIKQAIAELPSGNAIAKYEQQLQFTIKYQLSDTDPRELSEVPEIRLWFIRVDAVYPWLPFLLDWKSGELARYCAMLVPHQFSRSEGIIYNPEALEIFVMQKIFVLSDWFKKKEITSNFRLKSFAKLFGYEIDDAFINSLE